MLKRFAIVCFTTALLFSSCGISKNVSAVKEEKEVLERKLSDEEKRKFDYFLFEASRFKMHGDKKQAMRAYQQCLRIDDRSAVALYEIGNIYLLGNDVDNALPFILKASQINPNNEWYLLRLAQIYQSKKAFIEAADIYKRLIQITDDSDEYYYYVLANLYTSAQKYQEAIDIYDHLEQLAGVNEAIRIEKQRLYLLMQQPKKAYKEITELIKKYPRQSRYHIIYGDLLVETEAYDKAFKAYNRALELDPDNGPVHLSLSGYYDQTGDSVKSIKELKLAFASEEIGYEPKMQILVQYMMKASSDSSKNESVLELSNILLEHHSEREDLHYYYGNFLLALGNITEAKAQLLQVVKINPANSDVWLQLISIELENNNWDAIYGYGLEALKNDPISPMLYYYTGLAVHQKKAYKKAIEYYNKGVLYAENKPALLTQIYSNLADVYYQTDNKDMAFECFEKALNHDDHNIMVLNNYSYYLSLENIELDKAERMSSKCVELEPGNATYLDTYAWVLYKQGNYSLARFYIEQAIDNDGTSNSVVVEHYGDILYQLGEKEMALEQWKKSLELGNDSELLPKKIEGKKLIEE